MPPAITHYGVIKSGRYKGKCFALSSVTRH
jgi:hypothetical protein